jgi:hypothetical protein
MSKKVVVQASRLHSAADHRFAAVPAAAPQNSKVILELPLSIVPVIA